MVEDENGMMWIATSGGLVRYDGLTFEVYATNPQDSTSLLSPAINHIFPDLENGKIWLPTQRGLSVFDIQKKQFKNYLHDPQIPNSIPDRRLTHIFKDKENQIWIGTLADGIIKYRPETDDFEQFICNGQAPCKVTTTGIQADIENDSILWLIGTGVTRFNRIDGSYKNAKFQSEDEAEYRYANAPIQMLMGNNGKFYYGTWWYGVFEVDTKTMEISHFNPCYENGTYSYQTSSSQDVINSFLPINEHQFWINSWSGAQLYDKRTNCIIKAYNSDPKNKIAYRIDHIDKGGRIWSNTNKKGLKIFNPLIQQYEFLRFDEEDSPYSSNSISIVEDTLRKRIYVAPTGTSRGLHFYDQVKKEWNLILPPKGKKTNDIEGINFVAMNLLDNGEIIALSDSIYWYKPGDKRMRRYPAQAQEKVVRYRASLMDHEGMLWFGAWTGGFYRLNPKTQELHSFQEELAPFADRVLGGDHMTEDINGNIWMRENSGLLIWERATEKFIYHEYDPINLKAIRGMGRMISTEDGRVWIACNSEFLGYGHADSLDRGIIRYLSRDEGLFGSHVYAARKHRDQLLVFTEKGMQFFDPKKMQFGKFFDGDYGLGSSVFGTTWLKDGRLAICRGKRIAFFHPDSLKTNEELPVPYINSMRVFDEEYDLKSSPDQTDTIHLSYAQNFFSFEFSAVGYNLSEHTKFKYKLEGFDEKWQDGTQRRFAAYTNVPGGDYIFLVEAINNEGLSLGRPYELHIQVSTVWYKTGWFWLLTFSILSGIGYLIYRTRIAQVRKEERLKSSYEKKLANVEMSALRAQMNPHFIFNCLNSIEYYIISNEPEKAVDYLGRFSKLIRLILQNSKSTIVPLKDDLDALKLYIEMESLRFDNLFDYEVKMEKDIDPENVTVPPMLFQPYVENAIWHGLMQKRGGKGKLELTLRRKNGHLICLIEDNGIGREAAQNLKSKSATRRKSYGMKITSDRLAMLNNLAGADASVNIFDLKNDDGSAGGTRVELVVPI